MENEPLKLLAHSVDALASEYIEKYSPYRKVSSLCKKSILDDPVPGNRFKIGTLAVKNPVISAPLAGISDNTYRMFARTFGSSLTFTEMVTSYGIHYNHKKSRELARITGYERPCALQLFGCEPDIMAEAASRAGDSADIIDINMGCPVPKVLKAKSGGYLLQDEKRAARIISRMVSAQKKPVTVKTRTGWNRDSINVLNIARIAEYSGASAITIHGRTVKQGFAGEADYGIIRKVRETVNIPVIASGDIDTPQKALEVLDRTGCDGVMIGRAAKGSLWLFSDMVLFLLLAGQGSDTGEFTASVPSIEWKKRFAGLYLKSLVYFKGEYRAVREFRKHLSWIFKGTKGIARIRKRFFLIQDTEDAAQVISSIQEHPPGRPFVE